MNSKNTITAKTKCIIINFPHNPSGQVIEENELIELIQICEKNDIWLFSDEVSRLLGNPKNTWARPAACLYHKALSLGVIVNHLAWLVCVLAGLLVKMKILFIK